MTVHSLAPLRIKRLASANVILTRTASSVSSSTSNTANASTPTINTQINSTSTSYDLGKLVLISQSSTPASSNVVASRRDIRINTNSSISTLPASTSISTKRKKRFLICTMQFAPIEITSSILIYV